MEKKFNCHNCKHRRSIPGDCHSQCVHPKTGGERNVLESMALSFTGGDPQIDSAIKELNIQANPHGIRNGWFCWPGNFDPVWLNNCDGYESKQKKATA